MRPRLASQIAWRITNGELEMPRACGHIVQLEDAVAVVADHMGGLATLVIDELAAAARQDPVAYRLASGRHGP